MRNYYYLKCVSWLYLSSSSAWANHISRILMQLLVQTGSIESGREVESKAEIDGVNSAKWKPHSAGMSHKMTGLKSDRNWESNEWKRRGDRVYTLRMQFCECTSRVCWQQAKCNAVKLKIENSTKFVLWLLLFGQQNWGKRVSCEWKYAICLYKYGVCANAGFHSITHSLLANPPYRSISQLTTVASRTTFFSVSYSVSHSHFCRTWTIQNG